MEITIIAIRSINITINIYESKEQTLIALKMRYKEKKILIPITAISMKMAVIIPILAPIVPIVQSK